MIVPHRTQLEALPGGFYIVQALEDIIKEVSGPTMRVGQIQVSSGPGTPLNRVTGKIGDVYLRTDGSTSTTLYIKETGLNSKTGWVAK